MNTWSLVYIDVGILPNMAAISRRIKVTTTVGRHTRNADENSRFWPKPILMRTNVHQNLEDEKTQNRLFRIEPLGQYAWGLF